MSTKDFSTLISGREAPLVIGTMNGIMSAEGKLTVLLLDQADWVLRVALVGDDVCSTVINFQRQNPVVEALVMVSNVRVEQRVEKARLSMATTTPKTTIHFRAPDFEAIPMDFATPWTYVDEYEAHKTKLNRRYTVPLLCLF